MSFYGVYNITVNYDTVLLYPQGTEYTIQTSIP